MRRRILGSGSRGRTPRPCRGSVPWGVPFSLGPRSGGTRDGAVGRARPAMWQGTRAESGAGCSEASPSCDSGVRGEEWAKILGMRKTTKPAVPDAHQELHDSDEAAKMNSLRAGVLGANDGIVSVAALLIGVIATGAGDKAILMAGLAATIAGAVSMALGEYVSVSAQRDSEQTLIAKEKKELREAPEEELEELA